MNAITPVLGRSRKLLPVAGLIRARWEDGVTTREIADELIADYEIEVSEWSIRDYAMSRGWPRGEVSRRQRVLSPEQHERLLSQKAKGMTYRQLAEYWRMSEWTIVQYVKHRSL